MSWHTFLSPSVPSILMPGILLPRTWKSDIVVYHTHSSTERKFKFNRIIQVYFNANKHSHTHTIKHYNRTIVKELVWNLSRRNMFACNLNKYPHYNTFLYCTLSNWIWLSMFISIYPVGNFQGGFFKKYMFALVSVKVCQVIFGILMFWV